MNVLEMSVFERAFKVSKSMQSGAEINLGKRLR